LLVIGTIIVESKVAILLLGTLPESYDGLVVSLSRQTNLTISGVIGILLKELRQGGSGFSNLARGKVLYIGKPSFQKKKFTQHKNFLKTNNNFTYNEMFILQETRTYD
jgi:hypothetical protein